MHSCVNSDHEFGNVMMEKDRKKAYILRMADRIKTGLKDNVIGIGWAYAKNLDKIDDWDEFKHVIKSAYPGVYDSSYSLGNAAGSIWRFIRDMRKGDYVVVPSPDGFYVAECASDVAFFDSGQVENDFAWRRKVTWLSRTPIPRNFAKNELQRRLKARQTCVTATDLIDEIEQVLKRKKPINFTDEVLSGAFEAVASALDSAVTDRGLEVIVKNLIEASGAKASVLSNVQSDEGDIDVLAVYDMGAPQTEASIKVGIQVKQHSGETDCQAVRQLIPRIEGGEIALGCVVTTAETFSKEAVDLAEKYNILLVDRELLVEWVMKVGLDRFQ